ncbi:uveal autoantigen with coiled-coil domains and ankyrin repeats-like isoform X2 [Palaemon carinicauda]
MHPADYDENSELFKSRRGFLNSFHVRSDFNLNPGYGMGSSSSFDDRAPHYPPSGSAAWSPHESLSLPSTSHASGNEFTLHRTPQAGSGWGDWCTASFKAQITVDVGNRSKSGSTPGVRPYIEPPRYNNRFTNMKIERDSLIRTKTGFVDFFNFNSFNMLKEVWMKEIIPRKRLEETAQASKTCVQDGGNPKSVLTSSEPDVECLGEFKNEPIVIDDIVIDEEKESPSLKPSSASFSNDENHEKKEEKKENQGNLVVEKVSPKHDCDLKKMCKNYMENRNCLLGNACPFLHSLPKDDNRASRDFESGISSRTQAETSLKHEEGKKDLKEGICGNIASAGSEVRISANSVAKEEVVEENLKSSKVKKLVDFNTSSQKRNEEPNTSSQKRNEEQVSVGETYDPKRNQRCRHYLAGRSCFRGRSCYFLHRLPKDDNILCQHFLAQNCKYEASYCIYKHAKISDDKREEKEKKGSAEEVFDINFRKRCKTFLKNRHCSRGKECKFLHSLPKDDNIFCKHFQAGNCSKNAEDCNYKHGNGSDVSEKCSGGNLRTGEENDAEVDAHALSSVALLLKHIKSPQSRGKPQDVRDGSGVKATGQETLIPQDNYAEGRHASKMPGTDPVKTAGCVSPNLSKNLVVAKDLPSTEQSPVKNRLSLSGVYKKAVHPLAQSLAKESAQSQSTNSQEETGDCGSVIPNVNISLLKPLKERSQNALNSHSDETSHSLFPLQTNRSLCDIPPNDELQDKLSKSTVSGSGFNSVLKTNPVSLPVEHHKTSSSSGGLHIESTLSLSNVDNGNLENDRKIIRPSVQPLVMEEGKDLSHKSIDNGAVEKTSRRESLVPNPDNFTSSDHEESKNSNGNDVQKGDGEYSPSIICPRDHGKNCENNSRSALRNEISEIGVSKLAEQPGLCNSMEKSSEQPRLCKSKEKSSEQPGLYKPTEKSSEQPGLYKPTEKSSEQPGLCKPTEESSVEHPRTYKATEESSEQPGLCKSKEKSSFEHPGSFKPTEESSEQPGLYKPTEESSEQPGLCNSMEKSSEQPRLCKSKEKSSEQPGLYKPTEKSSEQPGLCKPTEESSVEHPRTYKATEESSEQPGLCKSKEKSSVEQPGPFKSMEKSSEQPGLYKPTEKSSEQPGLCRSKEKSSVEQPGLCKLTKESSSENLEQKQESTVRKDIDIANMISVKSHDLKSQGIQANRSPKKSFKACPKSRKNKDSAAGGLLRIETHNASGSAHLVSKEPKEEINKKVVKNNVSLNIAEEEQQRFGTSEKSITNKATDSALHKKSHKKLATSSGMIECTEILSRSDDLQPKVPKLVSNETKKSYEYETVNKTEVRQENEQNVVKSPIRIRIVKDRQQHCADIKAKKNYVLVQPGLCKSIEKSSEQPGLCEPTKESSSENPEQKQDSIQDAVLSTNRKDVDIANMISVKSHEDLKSQGNQANRSPTLLQANKDPLVEVCEGNKTTEQNDVSCLIGKVSKGKIYEKAESLSSRENNGLNSAFCSVTSDCTGNSLRNDDMQPEKKKQCLALENKMDIEHQTERRHLEHKKKSIKPCPKSRKNKDSAAGDLLRIETHNASVSAHVVSKEPKEEINEKKDVKNNVSLNIAEEEQHKYGTSEKSITNKATDSALHKKSHKKLATSSGMIGCTEILSRSDDLEPKVPKLVVSNETKKSYEYETVNKTEVRQENEQNIVKSPIRIRIVRDRRQHCADIKAKKKKKQTEKKTNTVCENQTEMQCLENEQNIIKSPFQNQIIKDKRPHCDVEAKKKKKQTEEKTRTNCENQTEMQHLEKLPTRIRILKDGQHHYNSMEGETGQLKSPQTITNTVDPTPLTSPQLDLKSHDNRSLLSIRPPQINKPLVVVEPGKERCGNKGIDKDKRRKEKAKKKVEKYLLAIQEKDLAKMQNAKSDTLNSIPLEKGQKRKHATSTEFSSGVSSLAQKDVHVFKKRKDLPGDNGDLHSVKKKHKRGDPSDPTHHIEDDGRGFPVRSATAREDLFYFMGKISSFPRNPQEEDFGELHAEFARIYEKLTLWNLLSSETSDKYVVSEANLRILLAYVYKDKEEALKIRNSLMDHWKSEPDLRKFKKKLELCNSTVN